MEERSLIHLIPILWKNKNIILGSSILAGVVTAVIMLLQPNYYQSSTTFYPVNNALLKPGLQVDNQNYYGDDRDVDRLLSMATSSELAQELIEEYQLANHYDIQVNDNKDRVKLMKRFRKLYNVQKTPYDAINLSVEDEDPEMAQKLTSAALENVDKKAHEVVTNSQRRMFDQLKVSLSANTSRLASVTDSLKRVKTKYGIYSTETQAEALTTLEIKSPSSSAVRSKIKNYSAGIAIVTNLESIQSKLNNTIADITIKMQQLETSIETTTPSVHIIEEADLPIEKSRPRRSLYVLGSMVLIGLLALSLVLIKESLSQLKTT